MKVDLHIHTTASDGCWDPEELIDEVKKAGVGLFAAVDHDSIGSIKAVSDLAPRADLHYISGVEFNSQLDGFICHILGYSFDPDDPGIAGLCYENTERMKRLNDAQIRQLKGLGLHIDLGEFEKYVYDKKRGGAKVTNFLVDNGTFKTFNESLAFVVKNVDWNVPDYPSPDQVVGIIKDAGGYAILAHPGSTLLSKGEKLPGEKLNTLIEMGIEGLECFTIYHDKETIQKYLDFCRKRDLLITAGSDCHGPLLKERSICKPEAHLEDLNLTGIWPHLVLKSQLSQPKAGPPLAENPK